MRALLTRQWFTSFGLLILRVFTGVLLIHHGFEKLANIDNFADAFVRPLHLPFPVTLSYAAAYSEIIGSCLLISGLATRLGAFAISCTITMAIYHALITTGFNIFLLELLGLYLGSSIAILAIGPGIFSIDELLVRTFKPDMNLEKSRLERVIVKTVSTSPAYQGSTTT